MAKVAQAAEFLAQHEREILDHPRSELKHELFATVTSNLPSPHRELFVASNFRPEDHESEVFLKHAEPTSLAKMDLSSEALCVDIYTNKYLKVESSPSRRKKKLIEQITAAWLEKEDGPEPPHERDVCSNANFKVYTDAGLALEDAQCCVYALSFYTGSGSNEASRGASLKVRQSNMLVHSKDEVEEYVTNFDHIIYFISLALRCLPYYWGYCVRFITLKEEMAATYEPGNIVTWMQFSSSKKGSDGASSFTGRNCKFVIWSIKGRHIARFSNYGLSEDEVLFTPFTRLLVVKHENNGGQYTIHLRELELGLTCQKGLPLLWVDDMILGKDFEMKGMMEEAMVKAGREIKYILKPSTQLALAFLESWFGQQLRKNKYFRVISDMRRPDEEEGMYAGVILAREMRRQDLSVPIMIFTSNSEVGMNKLREKAPSVVAELQSSPSKKPEANKVLITHYRSVALSFCSFEFSQEQGDIGNALQSMADWMKDKLAFF